MKYFFLCIFLLTSGCVHRTHLRNTIAEKPSRKPTEQFLFPLKEARLLSPFGKRNGTYHMGIDLQKNRSGGDMVISSRGGKVTGAKTMRGYGKIISIYHSDGYSTRYAHLRSFKVKTGENVAAGQPIGIVGQSGRASTPHLHFEILTPEGKFIDPMIFLRK